MNLVDRILRQIDFLPPFPVTVARALALLKNPDASVDEITEVIRLDQSIATNLLRFCNSSYVGLRRPITNIREAVVFVGLRHLRKILMITGTRPYFETRRPGYEDRSGELWRHVLAVSVISGHLVKIVPNADRDDVFLASLLHDVGKLVLSAFVEQEYLSISSTVESGRESFLDAERKILGTDHAAIGGRILTLWRFPEAIVHAVGRHHEPWAEGDPPMTDIVRLADSIAISMGYGTTVDGLAYHGQSEICRVHGISRSMLDVIAGDSLEEMGKIESEFGVTGEG